MYTHNGAGWSGGMGLGLVALHNIVLLLHYTPIDLFWMG
jgi:hypothetical protein